MIDITVLGDINVDLITSQIKNFPRKDRQMVAESLVLSPGGSSFNVAVASARLGLKTRFIGKLGKDLFSQYLIDSARSFGIDSKIKIDSKSNSGATLAINFEDGARSFISYKGSNNTLSLTDFKLKDIKGEIFSISGFNLLDGLRKDVRHIFEYARENGMETALDPNWDPFGWTGERLKQLKDVLPYTDLFFPDLDEGRKISGKFTPNHVVEKIASMGPKLVCLKLGRNGCLISHEKHLFRVPAIKVKPINTVGAGDVFAAAFLKSYLEEKSLYYCGRFASCLASISTTKVGLERYPKSGDVDCWLEKNIGKGWKETMTRTS